MNLLSLYTAGQDDTHGRLDSEVGGLDAIAGQIESVAANLIAHRHIHSDELTRQAQDEAKHFRMVKEVIEHMTGQPLDVAAAIAAEAAKPTAKGAGLLAKYGAENDAVALAAYQLVAEGRAEAVWNQMADCIEDEFISTSYAKIARDEGFHANIGGWKLEKLAQDEATQARVEALVVEMRRDLYDISCRNTVAAAAGKQLVADAYGW